MTTDGMRSARGRARDEAMGVHLKRIYTRIDDLDGRLKKIERIVWTLGAVAAVTAGTAIINLVTNMSQGGMQ
jgi:hypothetical protein